MSHAEQTARKLYDTMQLNSISEDVKRHLMILMLSQTSDNSLDLSESLEMPNSYEEAIRMGAKDIEDVRKDLHAYVDQLAKDYDLQ
ncbi:MAG: hypothetical protein MJZ32_02595 [Bacteroidaceae bacterium]|nr:hypothetical protein [Bacteroidaceae bacterium]